MLILENYINGKFEYIPEFIDNFDPSTGSVYCKVPNSGAEEVEKAVQAAQAAFKSWSQKPPADRAKILLRVSSMIEDRAEEFIKAETKDQGKPLWMSKTVDIPRAIRNFRHFATTAQCDKELALSQPAAQILQYTVRVPVGIIGVICPWNLPLYLLSFKLAPALVYGNTVVIKPSEYTSVTAWMLASVLHEAGLPPGVANFVFGYGHSAGEAIVRHPLVKAVSFTGSTKVGAHISRIAAPFAKKLSLEMGGKNAAIVFEDAEFKKCITVLIRSSFMNQGQICLCTSRIFVQKPLYEKFCQVFTQETQKLKVGPPMSEDVYLGPLTSKDQLDKVRFYLKLAVEEGAKVLSGGPKQEQDLPAENKGGYFLAPTILTNLPDNSRCMQEEIFGPVVCISSFDTEEEVIERVNGVVYGLCASLWSKDVSKIHRVAQKLEVGTTWCNCWMVRNLHMPFGGLKMSGIGREGTEASKEFATEVKSICVDYS